MVDFIVMVASVVLVDPRIKPDTVVTVFGHVVWLALSVLQLPVLIISGLFGGPRIGLRQICQHNLKRNR